jgi:CheY-like chemotaxis protein
VTHDPPSLDGLRVLVVEDNIEARAAITAVLEAFGALVIPVASAAAALAKLSHTLPDVMVSDIAMPDMDGHRFIRRVRDLDPARGGSTPAAALTAFATSADRTRALCAGFQAYLAKPFDPDELVTRVAHLARRAPGTH